MEVSIKRNPTTPTGYELVDNGVTTPITKIVDDGKTLVLPSNSSNRKYWSIEKVNKGEVELTYKETRTLEHKTNKVSTPKVNRMSDDAKMYLSEEEYETFSKLLKKIEFNKEVKLLNEQIAQLEAKKAEMMKGGE